VTVTRAVLLAIVGLLATDYHFGNGRLIELLTIQTAQLGHKLSDELSSLERRIAPFH
jgi:hypothetical protein